MTSTALNFFITILISPFLILRYFLNIISSNWRAALKLFLFVSFLSTILLFAFFIYQINIEVSQRYLFDRYSLQLEKVLDDNQKLEMSLIEANSLYSPSELMEKLNFEKIDKVSYIKSLKGEVVKK